MTQQINLFNPLFLKQQKYFSAKTMLQAIMLVALSMAVFYGYQFVQLASLNRQVAESTQAFEKQKAQLAAVSASLPQSLALAGLEQQIRELQATIAARQSLLQMLAGGDSAKSSGYAAYLAALARQVVDGVWLTSVHIGEGGSDLAITGRAAQPDLVPALIRKFNAEPVLRGRQFESVSVHSVAPIAAPSEAANRNLRPYFEFRLSSQSALNENASLQGRAAEVGSAGMGPATSARAPVAIPEQMRGDVASVAAEPQNDQPRRP